MQFTNTKRVTFTVGIGQTRTITVLADSIDEARMKAHNALDKKAEERGEEPPVGWTLYIKEIKNKPKAIGGNHVVS